MSEHFIKNIEIKNFKLFKDFKAEGFGRVNLIGGKNNVGKTALIEAIRTNLYGDNAGNLIVAIVKNKNVRETLNYYKEYAQEETITFLDRFIINPLKNTKYVDIKSNIRETIFIPSDTNGIITYQCKIDGQTFSFDPNKNILAPEVNNTILYIPICGLSYSDIVQRYASLQANDKEDFLNDALSIIDPSITRFKVIKDVPYCKWENQYIELAELGDGTQQFISIILSLFQAQNGVLFIDEIGYGIHYSNLDKLWEIILTLSKEQNVQVFATTHSKECIESYARVAKKLENDEIRFIDMGRNKNNDIKAIVMDSERLFRELNVGNEVRGW